MILGIPSVYLWLILLVACVVVETITVQLVSVWFAVGALGALIAAVLGASTLWQEAIFAVLSLILLLLIRPLVRRVLQTKNDRTNADRIIGQKAVVLQTIDNAAGTGQIRLLSQTWTARTEQEGIVIPEGTTVYVDKISGVKAMVVLHEDEIGGCKV